MSETLKTSTDCGRRDGDGDAAVVAAEAPAVSVGMTEGRGRGLFASKAMAEGDTVLVERPLVAMQSLDNAQDVMVCRNCLGFAGDVVSQLELLSGVPRHDCLERYERRCPSKDPVSTLSGDFSELHNCLQGCGEVYCSSKCRTEHFERCHHLLCVGPVPEEEAHTHPLVEFRVHAMQTNEIFLLVGEALAQVVACFFRNGGDLMNAQAPFADFIQEPWWEVAISRETEVDADPSSATASLHDTLRVLCEESSALLRRALALPAALEGVLTPERFGRVVGMFEQNNVGIRAPSPILAVLQEVITTGGDDVVVHELAALVSSLKVESDCLEDDEEDGCSEEEKGTCRSRDEEVGEEDFDDVDEIIEDPIGLLKTAVEGGDTASLFAPLDGTALYTLICCMNHSCRPNCAVRYPGRRKARRREADPLVAQVVLLENVEVGEELTQSYVDKSMGLLERRAALEDYGFFCRCLRCVEEEGIV